MNKENGYYTTNKKLDYMKNKEEVHFYIKTKQFEELIKYNNYWTLEEDGKECDFKKEENIFKIFIRDCKDVNISNHVMKYADFEVGGKQIHFASKYGFLDTVKHLIENECVDIDTKDNYGSTPLHYACETNNLKLIKYLIEQCGADPYYVDLNDCSPINEALDFKIHYENRDKDNKNVLDYLYKYINKY
jgi:hypothetical protein